MASARKIIIIGATSGIGYEITQLYRKQGWRIGIAGRRTELLAKIRSEAPDQIETAQIDVTCPDAPEKLAELIDRVGGMDVFLLSSGIGSQNRNLNSDIELPAFWDIFSSHPIRLLFDKLPRLFLQLRNLIFCNLRQDFHIGPDKSGL